MMTPSKINEISGLINKKEIVIVKIIIHLIIRLTEIPIRCLKIAYLIS